MKPPEHIFGTLKPFGQWVQECGWAASYGWRMRKRRMVSTINIAGKHYISADEIQRFMQRAKDGQFAKTPRMPSPRSRPLDPAPSGVGPLDLDTTAGATAEEGSSASIGRDRICA